MHHDFAKVVWVATPLEESHITDRTRFLAWSLLEAIFLNITDSFHQECDGEEDHRDDIGGFSKAWLVVLQHIRRVDDRDWKTDDPAPEHLSDPETKKGEEFVSLVVEAIIGASFENAEEEEARKTSAPQHDEDADYNVPGNSRTGKGEC